MTTASCSEQAMAVFEMIRQSGTAREGKGLRLGFLSERVPVEYRENLPAYLAELAWARLVDMIVEDRGEGKSEMYCFLAEKCVPLTRDHFLVRPDDAPGGTLKVIVWRWRPHYTSPGTLSAMIDQDFVSLYDASSLPGFLEITTNIGRHQRFETMSRKL